MKHIVFFDGTCGLCDYIVQILLTIDSKEIFIFAPLKGEVARQELTHLPEAVKGEDSLVLEENWETPKKEFFLLGNGALRILWLLGGFWKCIGWMYFLPSAPFDWLYRVVAKNRHRLFAKKQCFIRTEKNKHRFLP